MTSIGDWQKVTDERLVKVEKVQSKYKIVGVKSKE